MTQRSFDIGEIIDRLRRWCMDNRQLAIAAAVGIVSVLTLLIVLCTGPKTVDRGTDEAHNVSWVLLSDGTLRFSGEGEVTGIDPVYSEDGETIISTSEPAWYVYRDRITTVETGKKITRIGADSFVGFTALETLIVRGKTTEMDIECFRCSTEAEWAKYSSMTVFAPENSPARTYAEFNNLYYRPL